MMVAGGVVLYAVAALPGIGAVWYLLREAKLSAGKTTFLIALTAAIFAPSLAVLGHTPLIVPFALTPVVDNTHGLNLIWWNAPAAAIVFGVAVVIRVRSKP